MIPVKGTAMENETNDRREIDKARFRIDTTVNLAHILTTVALVVSIISWGSDLKSTVLKHDGDIADIKATLRDDRAYLREELREINRKIDKLVDGKANK
jgi:hypothetical protein